MCACSRCLEMNIKCAMCARWVFVHVVADGRVRGLGLQNMVRLTYDRPVGGAAIQIAAQRVSVIADSDASSRSAQANVFNTTTELFRIWFCSGHQCVIWCWEPAPGLGQDA